jgi:HlyD family secretion protein
MMTMRRVVGAVGALLLLGALVAAGAAAVAGGNETPFHVVEKSDFVRTVTAEGNLRASESTPLSAPAEVQGALKVAWIEKDGARVQRGDAVVRFDPTEFEDAFLSGSVQRQTVDNRLFGTGTTAGATRENLRRDASQAELEWLSAQSFQLTDEDIFSRRELIESMIDGDLALERKRYAEDLLIVRQRLSQADRELLEIERRKATLRVERAEKGLASLEVIAPHDGVVIFQRDWRGEMPTVGSMVGPGRPIGEIPNLEKMEAEVFVLEADAGGIAVGQRATVAVDASPGTIFSGTVKRVDALARPRIRGVPVQYFGVVLELERNAPELMKPGARVTATITIEQREEALTIPRQALFEYNGRQIVYVERSRALEPVEVELGPASLGRVVVISGLSEGDRVALTPPARDGENGR